MILSFGLGSAKFLVLSLQATMVQLSENMEKQAKSIQTINTTNDIKHDLLTNTIEISQ